MKRKIRIKKKATPSTGTGTGTGEVLTSILLKNKEVQVGTQLLVKHYSSSKWVKAELKRIRKEANGTIVFDFYIPSPGWITLTESRIKFAPKVRKKREGA